MILPTSMNLTAISFEILRIVSADTAELQPISLLSFLSAAIICFLIDVKGDGVVKSPIRSLEGSLTCFVAGFYQNLSIQDV